MFKRTRLSSQNDAGWTTLYQAEDVRGGLYGDRALMRLQFRTDDPSTYRVYLSDAKGHFVEYLRRGEHFEVKPATGIAHACPGKQLMRLVTAAVDAFHDPATLDQGFTFDEFTLERDEHQESSLGIALRTKHGLYALRNGECVAEHTTLDSAIDATQGDFKTRANRLFGKITLGYQIANAQATKWQRQTSAPEAPSAPSAER